MPTMMHSCVSVEWLIEHIKEQSGVDGVARFSDEDIAQLDELAALLAQGIRWLAGDCDNRRPDGHCAGHPIAEDD